MRSGWFGVLCLLSSVMLVGCTAQQRARSASGRRETEGRIFDNLRVRAAHDMACPEQTLAIRHLGDASYGVVGCDKRATYLLVHAGVRRWVLNSITADTSRAGRSPSSGASPAVSVTQGEAKDAVLNISLAPASTNLKIKLKAKPVVHPEVVLLGFERWIGKDLLKGCQVRMVANGELVPLPEGKYLQPSKTHELLAFEVPVDLLAGIAQAERVVAQVCADRVEFGESDLAAMRDFLVRFREEQALAGMVTPSEAPPPDSASL